MIPQSQSAHFLNPLYGIFWQSFVEYADTLMPVDLAVDGDRSGTETDPGISFGEDDKTSEDEPYEFWINNDRDWDGEEHNGTPINLRRGEDREITNNGDLNLDNELIDGYRDLEDLSRLWLKVPAFIESLQSGSVQLGFKWKDGFEKTPGIRLFESADEDGGLGHVFVKAIAETQQANPFNASIATIVAGESTQFLPITIWEELQAGEILPFLFEGISEGKGELEIVIKASSAGSESTAQTGVYLELKDVRDMFERYEVLVDGMDSFSVKDQGTINGILPENISDQYDILPRDGFRYGAIETEEENDYILFVHGWRMQYWEKNAFAETGYKRLFWQNYKGRFGAFFWPTEWTPRNKFEAIKQVLSIFEFGEPDPEDDVIPDVPNDVYNYGRSDRKARLSGRALDRCIATLNSKYTGRVRLFAHSMGNIITSEALRIRSQSSGSDYLHTYVAAQSAAIAHGYDTQNPATIYDEGFNGVIRISTHNLFAQYPDESGSSYFGSIKSTVGEKIINFHNKDDLALQGAELAPMVKPYPGYIYSSSGLWQYGEWKTGGHPLSSIRYFDVERELTLPEDRHEIFGLIAEGRSKAVGAAKVNSNFVGGPFDQLDHLDLNSPDIMGSVDERFTDLSVDHSAQWMSYNAVRFSYWKLLLNKFLIDTDSEVVE